MERAMANMEFGFGEGGYQPSEFIKRYLPQGTFDLLIADEAHEYKNGGSAQGQAMGVLAAKARKTLLLTGTLMGGYGDDLFYLLFRALPGRMIEDGYRPTTSGSMTSAAMAFMRDHGVLKDIYSESTGTAHKTAKGTKVSVRTVKAPGFGPKGVLRCILPFTIFLKLKDIGGNVLPPYDEEFREVAMDTAQAAAYRDLAGRLTAELKQALARRDTTLLGVVLNVLLAWPDCCFRSETVVHPRTRNTLAFVPAQFNEFEVTPKERELIDICKEEKAQGRKVLAYTVYTGTRDTTSRLKVLLEQEGSPSGTSPSRPASSPAPHARRRARAAAPGRRARWYAGHPPASSGCAMSGPRRCTSRNLRHSVGWWRRGGCAPRQRSLPDPLPLHTPPVRCGTPRRRRQRCFRRERIAGSGQNG